MRTIKQITGDGKCVAACAAMICDSSIEHFESVIGKGHHEQGEMKGYCDQEFMIYILLHGTLTGYSLDRTDIDFRKNIGTAVIKNLKGTDAYVCVKSNNYKGATHAVIWDSAAKVIRDPDPNKPETSRLSEYKILDWIPVYSFNCHHAMKNLKRFYREFC